MSKINNILKLDLQEDIKNVIDLEDQSEQEIQSEIETYIVTDGLGKQLSKFIDQYTGNIKETGVWLSGFYGSGKSYFGKMLGYLIANPTINGTPARDRFIPRLRGVANENLIENDIRKLDAINSRVIFLDIAKQNTENGLAFTLFACFLKNLGFRDDVYGFIEYDLFIDSKLDTFREKAKQLFGKPWEEIRKNNREVAKAMRRVHLEMDFSEKEYDETLAIYNHAIGSFSASKFKDELEKYISKNTDETLVFIFDEASEAISQKKFNLTELEGLSESLSSISKKVWTIAIAQEKLDDVITNAKINKSQLIKVTDRFKTKIHLESTEVDVIIRNRLLQKKEDAQQQLVEYFKQNDGLISDATNLKSAFPTKTLNAEQFAIYYPFHRYQFDLLQKFLFSSNALVATQIAARGMIITTFDVLRKELRNRPLFEFTTAHDLCSEAQTSPPAELVNKYNHAAKIISDKGIQIDGEKLMKTIHFITESELVSATVENITKSYIADTGSYYTFKPWVEESLGLLVEAKILLLSNNNYKITSSLEGKMLEEMRDFSVEIFVKKKEVVGYLKKFTLFRQVAIINDDSVAYNFRIQSDLEDEIVSSSNKNLKLTVYNLFNINEDRQDFIENIRLETQYSKDVITLVPDNSAFDTIDKLLDESKRYAYMEEKYNNDDDPARRQIIREFVTIKEEKEKDLINLIEDAYANGSLIYLFDENLLNKDNFKGTVTEVQRKLIKNTYTKRLKSQLSESIGPTLLNESNATKLHKYFSGDEFRFFDANGNFSGEHLKVVEEITSRINKKYLDGKSLEDELAGAPWGYAYGTVSTTLAALFRAGRLVVKFNDTEYFSHNDKQAHEAFATGAKFKKAAFKSVTKTLSAAQKNQIIQVLLDLDYPKHIGNKIDWKASDFDAAQAITQLAEAFVAAIKTLKNTQAEFEKLFPGLINHKDALQNYCSKTTEANYIEKAEYFLETKDAYIQAIKAVVDTEKFIKKNLARFNGFSRFVIAVNNELRKADIHNDKVKNYTAQFEAARKENLIDNFGKLQDFAQKIRDEYFTLMSANAEKMSTLYASLQQKVTNAIIELSNHYPAQLNTGNLIKLKSLLAYCESRVLTGVNLEFHIECQDSKYSLSDILNYIALSPSKEMELETIKGSFVKEAPPQPDPEKPKEPRKIKLCIQKKVMKAAEYRTLLASQIQAMAGMDNEDEVEVNVE